MKLRSRMRPVCLSIVLSSMALPAFVTPPAFAQTQTAGVALQRGYRTGYSDGYMAGYRDTIDSLAKSYARHGDYAKADRAFNKEYGSVEDYRDDPQNFDFRSRLRGSVSWQMGKWTTTVFGTRYGSTPNWAETGRIGSWKKYNLNVSHQFNDHLSASIIINNVLNEAPPRDPTFDTYPYFSTANYDPYGREGFLQLNYKFN